MNLDELTLGQIKEIQAMSAAPSKSHSFKVGTKYLIRTVTMHHLGRLVAVTETDLVLEEASWLASSGRFHNALATGEVDEVEPFCDNVIVARGGIVDATEWKHELPGSVK